jgi:hypothetical protein
MQTAPTTAARTRNREPKRRCSKTYSAASLKERPGGGNKAGTTTNAAAVASFVLRQQMPLTLPALCHAPPGLPTAADFLEEKRSCLPQNCQSHLLHWTTESPLAIIGEKSKFEELIRTASTAAGAAAATATAATAAAEWNGRTAAASAQSACGRCQDTQQNNASGALLRSSQGAHAKLRGESRPRPRLEAYLGGAFCDRAPHPRCLTRRSTGDSSFRKRQQHGVIAAQQRKDEYCLKDSSFQGAGTVCVTYSVG